MASSVNVGIMAGCTSVPEHLQYAQHLPPIGADMDDMMTDNYHLIHRKTSSKYNTGLDEVQAQESEENSQILNRQNTNPNGVRAPS